MSTKLASPLRNSVSVVVERSAVEHGARPSTRTAAIAWLVAALYYFFQYVLRSAPSVMMPQLSSAFGISVVGAASLVGLFYYGYSPCSLLAGAGMDTLGPRRLIPVAAAIAGIGALLFSTGDSTLGPIGRLLQGAGGVFAPVGAIYIASTYFSPSKAATLIGATQMFGMAGGAVGQFVVGPMITKRLAWNHFWIGLGISGLVISALLFTFLPKESKQNMGDLDPKIIRGFWIVFKNPQSILCGLIAGLLFIPTTIFDMVWGVRYLQQAHGFDYSSAVLRTAMVPLGWIIGCPLLGFISDRLGRRKPVIIGAAALLGACLMGILFGPKDVFPPYTLGLVAGIASGAAMLPYTVIKEANPRQFGGIATGVVNFLNFMCTALLGPVFGWILQYLSRNSDTLRLEHYRLAFAPMTAGVAIAIALTLLLHETGAAARAPSIKHRY